MTLYVVIFCGLPLTGGTIKTSSSPIHSVGHMSTIVKQKMELIITNMSWEINTVPQMVNEDVFNALHLHLEATMQGEEYQPPHPHFLKTDEETEGPVT